MVLATTGKIANVMFERAKDTYEHQMQMVDLVTLNVPDPEQQQNSDNVTWYPVQQHAPIINGWDISGQEQDIIEETYPSILETPTNDFIKQRADQLRDRSFWERRAEQSGKRQATELNKRIAQRAVTQGSIFYRSNATSGFDFIAEGETILNERQAKADMGRSFILNDRDNLKYSKDLASRETIKGRPADTWKTGQIGSNVAEFDVFTGSYLPNLVGGADPATTVTGDQSFKPEAGTVNTTTGVVTNVDYRLASIPVAASGSYNVGDKVQFANGGTPVESIGLADKTETGQPMTFTIVGIPDGTTIQVYPKPIAADDPGLTTLEAAYANINTQILNTATVNRLNTDASAKTNIFWAKEAIEVVGGTVPAKLFKQFDGMQVIQDTLSNGLEMYMVYDGQIDEFTFRFRIFVWYGITVCNPSAVGVAVSF